MEAARRWGSGVRSAAAAAAVLALLVAPQLLGADADAGPPPAGTATIEGPAYPTRELTVVLGLDRRQQALARFVAEISDPRSSRYRHFLAIEEVARRFGASPRTRHAVLAYLLRRGVHARVDPTGTFAEANMTVGQAGDLFATHLAAYRSPSGASFLAPTDHPRLPGSLRGHVRELLGLNTAPAIEPGVGFSDREASAVVAGSTSDRGASAAAVPIPPRSGTPRGCRAGVASGGFTPNQLVHAYGVDRLHRRGIRGQTARVALVEWGGASRADLRTFVRCFGLRMPRRFKQIRIDGGKPLPPNGEAVADTEVIAAIAPRLGRLEMFEIDPGDTIAQSAATLPRLFAAPLRRGPGDPLPDVISSSLGDCEQQVVSGRQWALVATEHVLMSAAAAGVTVVSGAGDWGSTGCVDDAEQIVQPPRLAVFYPASSPHVTAVGGTFLKLGRRNRIRGERVWNDTRFSATALLGGGGGVSRILRRPRWQRGPGVSKVRPRPVRAVPDVAFFADGAPGYALYCSIPNCRDAGLPPWNSLGGTSFATPLFAAGLALVDQDLRQHGRRRIGFANPLIYLLARRAGGSRGPVFRDVQRGDNDVAGVGCCNARRNFDAASGWGSLDLGGFAKVVRRLRSR